MSADRWLTLPDAAARVGRSERTIRNWIEAGEIRPILKRFRESDLLEVEKRMRARIGRPRRASKVISHANGGQHG